MSDFNYQEYLKNNPLLQEEVKEEQLITEAEDKNVEEVMGIDRKGNKKPDVEMSKAAKAKQDAKDVKEEEVTEEEIQEEVPSSKMKVSELKAKIKEDIISLLQEEEEEDVEAEIEDEVDVDVDTEEPAVDAVSGGDEGLTADEKEIQDSLKLAYDNAVAIGDTKLADQIGNSITFFTRTHVVER
jgi:hypothetical protein